MPIVEVRYLFSTNLFFQIVFTLFTVKQYSPCLLLCMCLFVPPPQWRISHLFIKEICPQDKLIF